jgi:hypothetical protein
MDAPQFDMAEPRDSTYSAPREPSLEPQTRAASIGSIPDQPQVIGAYAVHPFAGAFDMLSEAELAELAQDIHLNGLHEAITIHHGAVLDGRNRLAACLRAGVAPRFVDVSQLDDAAAFELVWSRNLHRRHLNESQRAMAAAKLRAMHPRGVAGHLANLPIAKLAEMMNVSPRTVVDAVAVQRADPHLAAQVASGQRSVSGAARQIRRSTTAPLSGGHRSAAKLTAPASKVTTSELNDRISASLDALEGTHPSREEWFKAGMLAADFLRRLEPRLDAEAFSRLRARLVSSAVPSSEPHQQTPAPIPGMPWATR